MLRYLTLCGVFIACWPAAAADTEYPFVGRWDCEVAEFTFTSDTYNNGSEDLPILKIEEEAQDSYTLAFADDYKVFLAGVSKERMSWASSSGEHFFECTRVE